MEEAASEESDWFSSDNFSFYTLKQQNPSSYRLMWGAQWVQSAVQTFQVSANYLQSFLIIQDFTTKLTHNTNMGGKIKYKYSII